MSEMVSLIGGDVVRKVTQYIVEHGTESANPYNMLFVKALSSVIPNAHELIFNAAQTTVGKTIEVKGEEPDIDARTLAEWLSRYRGYADDASLTSAFVFARLVLLEAMLRGDAWVDQVGQNMVVIATEGGGKFKLTKFGVLY